MLDTSFLIAYADPEREHHAVAKAYFREAIRLNLPLLLSTLVVAEFERRQPLSQLGLHNFRVLPFNFDDGQEAARLAEELFPKDAENDRVCLVADVKILAQAKRAGARVILTEDHKSMAKYVDGLRQKGLIDCYPVLTKDGFDAGKLIDPATPGLPFPLPAAGPVKT
ncbi:putative nucleic acid-binding protein [Lysobacter niastensis]|uniref:Nucleic acid-binding protein n=1 Tax=Lysobacter niastensis TaxID=380629 RepID=A0ABU1WCW9_9GAMM|nr:PIN domain-containing protein [Lysobacter niastensis]MDR7135249.1 putative nucleic acid-binding protein [Lysobacter niastensis]